MVTSCPQCSAGLAEYDSEAGANFCQSCGFQVSVEELCSEVERNPDGQQYGTFVAANGRVAGASLAVPAFTSVPHTLPHIHLWTVLQSVEIRGASCCRRLW